MENELLIMIIVRAHMENKLHEICFQRGGATVITICTRRDNANVANIIVLPRPELLCIVFKRVWLGASSDLNKRVYSFKRV